MIATSMYTANAHCIPVAAYFAVFEQEIDSPKALLRRWLSLVHLGKMVEADQIELDLQGLPFNGDMRRSLDAHKQAIAAEEERQKSGRRSLLTADVEL